jgi:protein-tyrosine-phosphatase
MKKKVLFVCVPNSALSQMLRNTKTGKQPMRGNPAE